MENDELGAEADVVAVLELPICFVSRAASLIPSYAPNEKKSTAGAADTLDNGSLIGASGLSSNDIFALPLANDRGRKGSEEPPLDDVDVGVFVDVGCVGSSPSSSFSSSPSSTATLFRVEGVVDRVLKTSPGPFPPPNTRSG